MDDRPLSRSSTIRAQPIPRHASLGERESFLAAALSRLSLSPRPPTPAPPALASSSQDEGGTTVARLESLASETSDPSAGGGGGAQPVSLHSLSGSRTSAPTRSFLDETISRDEQESLADEYVSYALFSGTEDGSFAGSKSERLRFYQALVVQFGRCEVEEVPSSITACKSLLRGVHICLKEYLDVVKRGGNVATEVTQYILEGQTKKKNKRTVPLDVVKSELLEPFLIEL